MDSVWITTNRESRKRPAEEPSDLSQSEGAAVVPSLGIFGFGAFAV